MGKMITTSDVRVQRVLVEDQKRREEKQEEKRREKFEERVSENWEILKKQGHGVSPCALPIYPAVKDLFHNVVDDNAWKGRRCFIIGGGPSLKSFDFGRLSGELTIGVNRAYEEFDCDIMFATDLQYYKWIENGEMGVAAKKRFKNFRGHKVWLDSRRYPYMGVKRLTGLHGHGLSHSMKTGLCHGGNSGYGALNLAVCLGANPIYLLGFDMKGENTKQAWWHNGYPKTQSDKVYAMFIKHFEFAVPILKDRGIQVINLNPDSAMKCFEFGELENVLMYDYEKIWDSKEAMPPNKKTLLFDGCIGLGDNFYQRPIIKEAAKNYRNVYVVTAFPEVYWDIPNVKFVRSSRISLRTQLKHMDSLPAKTWTAAPPGSHHVHWSRIGPSSQKQIQTKYVELENEKDFDFSLPVRNAWIEAAEKVIEKLPLNGKKLCIIRRPTVRQEWKCPSRNPKIEYYQLLVDRYKDEYFYLGLADVKPSVEWFDGELQGLDKEFNKGELPLTTILGLMKIADMTITYPSFFMIAAVGIRAKCYTIYGGAAKPEHCVRDKLGLMNFALVAPEPMCNCHSMRHNCIKEIPPERVIAGFEELKNREKYVNTVTVGVPPGMGDSYWVINKLESFKEKNGIDVLKVAILKDEKHPYAAEFLKLFPLINEVVETKKLFDFRTHWNLAQPCCIVKNCSGVDYLIDFGGVMWLKDVSLHRIHPEYDTNHSPEIVLPEDARQWAVDIKAKNNGKLVLFYTSAIGNNRNWNVGMWGADDWLKLAELIHSSTGIRPIQIGATWDRDYANALAGRDKTHVLQDYVGKTSVTQTLSLIKEANLVVGFPCGVPIMATSFGVPTVMFWGVKGISRNGRFNPAFQYTWVSPKHRKSGRYIPVIYGSRQGNADWIFNRVKEFL